jgi:hypothetical protein
VCDRDDDDESMLLCDGCDAGYHMGCLSPPLTSVPPGDWFCPPCADRKRKEARRWACSVCQPNGPYTMTFDEANECEDRHITEAEEADGVDESANVVNHSSKNDYDEIKRMTADGSTLKEVCEIISARTGRKPKSVEKNYYHQREKRKSGNDKHPSDDPHKDDDEPEVGRHCFLLCESCHT